MSTTVPYTDIKDQVEAKLGASLQGPEATRLLQFVNDRAHEAYLRTVYWPDYLVVGEERTVTSRVIPRAQASLNDIEHIIRIHEREPWANSWAKEYEFIQYGTNWKIVGTSDNPSSVYVTYQKAWDGPYHEGDDIPAVWSYFLATAAYADMLAMTLAPEEFGSSQGIGRAQLFERKAQELLAREMLRLDLHGNSSTIKRQIKTHSNQQARL